MKLQEIKSIVLETFTTDEVKKFGKLTLKSTWESALQFCEQSKLVNTFEESITLSESSVEVSIVENEVILAEIVDTPLKAKITPIQSTSEYSNPSIIFLLPLILMISLASKIYKGFKPLFKNVKFSIPRFNFRPLTTQLEKYYYACI